MFVGVAQFKSFSGKISEGPACIYLSIHIYIVCNMVDTHNLLTFSSELSILSYKWFGFSDTDPRPDQISGT